MTTLILRAPPDVDAVDPASFIIRNRLPSGLMSHIGDLDEPASDEKYAPLKISLGCPSLKSGSVSTATAMTASPLR